MLRVGQKLGKYRITRRLAESAFANVYQAQDTIEGGRVAMKVPHGHLVNQEVLDEFRREVRLMVRLNHPNILPLKDASLIDKRFVIITPLGERTLADRFVNRMSLSTSLNYAEQMLRAVAYAHSCRIIHCDIKPENLIIFPDNVLRLTDFGIAMVAYRTVQGSGSGTIGYMAPEQAMGKPSFRSDVFSMGLILYRMFSGHLPEWPYSWPPPSFDRLRGRISPEMISVIRRAMELDPRKRYKDGEQMEAAFAKAKAKMLRSRPTKKKNGKTQRRNWQEVRHQQFRREHGSQIEMRFACSKCGGPVAESMTTCPWCGTARKVHRDGTKYPAQCPRCGRGMKLDWTYCPWCHGAGFEVETTREYSDVRYEARCSNTACTRKSLMPFMRYCPWCRQKVRRKWKLPDSTGKCHSCGWGVYKAYWTHCPWCGVKLTK